MNKTLNDDIETLMDRYGMEEFISACTQVCGEKADHIRSAWQDENMAKGWDMLARHFSRVGTKKMEGK